MFVRYVLGAGFRQYWGSVGQQYDTYVWVVEVVWDRIGFVHQESVVSVFTERCFATYCLTVNTYHARSRRAATQWCVTLANYYFLRTRGVCVKVAVIFPERGSTRFVGIIAIRQEQ